MNKAEKISLQLVNLTRAIALRDYYRKENNSPAVLKMDDVCNKLLIRIDFKNSDRK